MQASMSAATVAAGVPPRRQSLNSAIRESYSGLFVLESTISNASSHSFAHTNSRNTSLIHVRNNSLNSMDFLPATPESGDARSKASSCESLHCQADDGHTSPPTRIADQSHISVVAESYPPVFGVTSTGRLVRRATQADMFEKEASGSVSDEEEGADDGRYSRVV